MEQSLSSAEISNSRKRKLVESSNVPPEVPRKRIRFDQNGLNEQNSGELEPREALCISLENLNVAFKEFFRHMLPGIRDYMSHRYSMLCRMQKRITGNFTKAFKSFWPHYRRSMVQTLQRLSYGQRQRQRQQQQQQRPQYDPDESTDDGRLHFVVDVFTIFRYEKFFEELRLHKRLTYRDVHIHIPCCVLKQLQTAQLHPSRSIRAMADKLVYYLPYYVQSEPLLEVQSSEEDNQTFIDINDENDRIVNTCIQVQHKYELVCLVTEDQCLCRVAAAHEIATLPVDLISKMKIKINPC